MQAAIGAGYLHVDTAAAYGNEREVGNAIRTSGVDRSEIVVETTVWCAATSRRCAAGGDRSAAAIATSHGFGHGDRFSGDYRRVFACAASETLAGCPSATLSGPRAPGPR